MFEMHYIFVTYKEAIDLKLLLQHMCNKEEVKGSSPHFCPLSVRSRLVLSTRTPSSGCRVWCDQGNLHQTTKKVSPTAQTSPGDHSTGRNMAGSTTTFTSFCNFCLCTLSSHVYMADLESTLHYSLRMELSAHSLITGDALVSLKMYISVLVKVKLCS